MPHGRGRRHGAGAGRVSTLELFFDLVFVFTVNQLTNVLVDKPNLTGLVEVSVMLGERTTAQPSASAC